MKNRSVISTRRPKLSALTVMMYVRYPLVLRQVEDLLHERGIDIFHETVRSWGNRVWPKFSCGDSESAVFNIRLIRMALAPGRGVREDSTGETHYSVACL